MTTMFSNDQKEQEGRIILNGTATLRARNDMSKLVYRESDVRGQLAGYFSIDGSDAKNGLYISERTYGTLEVSKARQIDYLFPFVATFFDSFCVKRNNIITAISTIYIDIVDWVMDRPLEMLWTDKQ